MNEVLYALYLFLSHFLHINISVPFSFVMYFSHYVICNSIQCASNYRRNCIIIQILSFLKCWLWWFNLTDPHNAQHFIFVKICKLKLVQSLKSSFSKCQLQSYGWNCLTCFFYIIINVLFISHFDATNIQISKKLKIILIKQSNNNCMFRLHRFINSKQ